MQALFNLLIRATDSAGAATLILAILMALPLHPLTAWGKRIENRIGARADRAQQEARALPRELRGEERFLATEKIYRRHDYHPAQNIMRGMSFIAQLPILIPALVLLLNHPSLTEQPFGIIADLSRPDGLAGGIHLLPFLTLAVGITESYRRHKGAARRHGIAIAVLLCPIIYPLPSALVLYWLTQNIAGITLTPLLHRLRHP